MYLENKPENLKELKEKIRDLEYQYWLDKTEFGKIMIIASLSILVVSVHAIYVMEDAHSQAAQSQEDLRTTSAIVENENFQSSLENMPTGFTAGGMDGDEILVNLQHSVDSIEDIDTLADDLDNAKTTYQWMVLVGILGVVAGITSIYI